jgi:hypothetical protein
MTVAITTSHLRSITHLRMVLNICQVLGVSAETLPFTYLTQPNEIRMKLDELSSPLELRH